MKKQISDKTKIILAFLTLTAVALISDYGKEGVLKEGTLSRGNIGEDASDISLRLDVEQLLEAYEYEIELQPVRPTEEMADEYFAQAIAQIDEAFADIGEKIPITERFLDGIVEAEWTFQPYGLIQEDGTIQVEKLVEEDTIISAQVILECGAYEKVYTFSFLLEKPELSESEQILQQIQEQIDQQMLQEDDKILELPTVIDGKTLRWTEEKEYLTPQILVVEAVAILLIWVATQRQKKEEAKKRLQEMEQTYPEIVNQLALLMGAGMTSRQAWSRIGAQYRFKRKEGLISSKLVYEEILRMNRRFSEGEIERIVYQKFTEVVSVPCFRKLTRTLLGGVEKGNGDLVRYLEAESRQAFEKRILQAKKLGEEASTKMMLPLMLMLMLVMGLVMLPALIEFKI